MPDPTVPPASVVTLAERIVARFSPSTMLDAGCSTGHLVQALRDRGVDATGIDVSGSVTEPLPGRYDLIVCIGALEHLAPVDVPAAVANLCASADVVLLSSTGDAEHYGEPAHTGMRPPEDWAALFAEHRFLRDLDTEVDWVSPWAMVLRRSPGLALPDVVRAYDRRVARLQREAYELRRSALALQHELADRHDDDLHRELERLRAREDRAAAALTESLRLRDLLIVAERELGEARGEVALLRDRLEGYDDLAAKYQALVGSRTWRLAWKVLGPYRRARERIGV